VRLEQLAKKLFTYWKKESFLLLKQDFWHLPDQQAEK
jgi:hypothetical protein